MEADRLTSWIAAPALPERTATASIHGASPVDNVNLQIQQRMGSHYETDWVRPSRSPGGKRWLWAGILVECWYLCHPSSGIQWLRSRTLEPALLERASVTLIDSQFGINQTQGLWEPLSFSATRISHISQRFAEQMGAAQRLRDSVVPLSTPCIPNSGPPAGAEGCKLLSRTPRTLPPPYPLPDSRTEARFHQYQAQLRRIGRREKSSF